MNITVLLEGRAGHEKQSLAIVRELQMLTDVNVQQIKLPATSVLGRLAEFFNIVFSGGNALGCSAKDTDLFLGTGSRTHLALIACKNKYRKPIVTCMAPEPFLRRWFDLCCVPRHDGMSPAKNIFFTDGPPVLSSPELSRDPFKGLILVGGVDDRSHQWQGEDIVNTIEKIVSDNQDVRWSVSSSPRTPEATVDLLKQRAVSLDNFQVFPFQETPRGWVEEQYAQSTYTWVTADSVSMVYEAVTAGCRVGVLPVKWNNPNNKFQKSLDYLHERKLIAMYDNEGQNSLDECDSGNFNEARRCALEILNRFFPRVLRQGI
ncbi:mitochondrial fission ELM1 family protein [Desulfopila aestuarii]|uniref:Uncharacterized protein n=1 Tax=Desulfopila aestuarii DSM 18488 TaxID=1121416 RepID=A0A1M7Y2H3_9BACT|nr:ELM1/GtrOC1 family putative glycosyltransferase [Desulfopila aestuarii]SHO45963.1 hypothetical protein SAMN02745220_01277 [Desulfopila aestuarii DSM 18488]